MVAVEAVAAVAKAVIDGVEQREGISIWSTIVSVPSSELALPPPSSQVSVCPPTWIGGGGGTLLGGGGGSPLETTGQKLWHSVYSVVLRCRLQLQSMHKKIQQRLLMRV